VDRKVSTSGQAQATRQDPLTPANLPGTQAPDHRPAQTCVFARSPGAGKLLTPKKYASTRVFTTYSRVLSLLAETHHKREQRRQRRRVSPGSSDSGNRIVFNNPSRRSDARAGSRAGGAQEAEGAPAAGSGPAPVPSGRLCPGARIPAARPTRQQRPHPPLPGGKPRRPTGGRVGKADPGASLAAPGPGLQGARQRLARSRGTAEWESGLRRVRRGCGRAAGGMEAGAAEAARCPPQPRCLSFGLCGGGDSPTSSAKHCAKPGRAGEALQTRRSAGPPPPPSAPRPPPGPDPAARPPAGRAPPRAQEKGLGRSPGPHLNVAGQSRGGSCEPEQQQDQEFARGRGGRGPGGRHPLPGRSSARLSSSHKRTPERSHRDPEASEACSPPPLGFYTDRN